MAVSEKMKLFAAKSSWIRKMFEEGARMKAAHGAMNVCDFSLGNPDAPPPPQYNEVIQEIIKDTSPGVHSYMPNGGYPWVREAIAGRMSAEQQVAISSGDMLMTCGAAGGLNIVLKGILNPGDEVIILAPYLSNTVFTSTTMAGLPRLSIPTKNSTSTWRPSKQLSPRKPRQSSSIHPIIPADRFIPLRPCGHWVNCSPWRMTDLITPSIS